MSHSKLTTLIFILLLYEKPHIFILEILEKLGIYYRIMLVLLLFMHLLDYCNSLLYNVPMHKTDRLQRLQNQYARILKKSPWVLKTYIGSKFRIESHIKIDAYI